MKAMLISMGGRLDTKLTDSDSEFDAYIVRNFNTNLNVTLISNPRLRHFFGAEANLEPTPKTAPKTAYLTQTISKDVEELRKMVRRVKDSTVRLNSAFDKLQKQIKR